VGYEKICCAIFCFYFLSLHFYCCTHFSAIGHALVGDEVYGKASKLISRHALHAHELAFNIDGKPFCFTQPLPEDMQKLI
jgi:hypothetical protein